MNTKKRKFFLINKAINLLNEESKSICLVAHINDMNIQQNNNINYYCSQNNIKAIAIKLNLLHKLTKNTLFLNICSGPTKLFFFKDPVIFNNFVKEESIQQKIIPLGVYFNNEFFSYKIFRDKLDIYFKQDVNLKTYKVNFLLPMSNKSKNLLRQLPQSFNNFLQVLEVVKKQKNI